MRRAAGAVVTLATATALLAACTLLSPLDYLQNGGPADVAADVGDEVESDAGAEAGLVPTTFAAQQDFPGLVGVDGTDVYWTVAGTTPGIMGASKAGGAPRRIAAGPADVVALVVEPGAQGSVFWASGKEIRSAPKQGGDGGASVVYTAVSPITAFAVDDVSLFVAEADDTNAIYAIARQPKTGGARDVLNDVDSPVAIALDTTSVVWNDSLTTVVRTLPKTAAPDSGAPTVDVGETTNDPIIASGPQSFVLDVATNAVFWCDGTLVGRHLRTPGVNGQTLYTDPDTSSTTLLGDIAVDDTFVWLVQPRTQEILRVPKSGGDAAHVLAKQVDVRGIATDGTRFWFTLQGSDAKTGSVLSIPAK